MSYILKIWNPQRTGPLPLHTAEVADVVDRLEEQPEKDGEFRVLVERLTERFPSISGAAVQRVPLYEWAWADGSLDPASDSGVYTLGLNATRLADVRPFVVQQARNLGFAVLDPQSGEVFLPQGQWPPSEAATATAQPVQPALAGQLDARGLASLAFERLASFLEPQGYKARKGDRTFTRAFKGGWHRVKLAVLDAWPHPTFGIIVDTRVDPVAELHASIVAPEKSAKDTKDWSTLMLRQEEWLPVASPLIEPERHLYRPGSVADAHRALDDLTQQWHARVVPILDEVQDVEGVDRMLNTQPLESSVFFHGHGALDANILSAYLARNPRLFAIADELLSHVGGPAHRQAALKCLEYVRAHPLA